MKTISVVIPNYNNVCFIRECILSVINQSYQPNEIIVVDDCSTDGSREIIEELSKKYDIIHPIFLDKNQGVSHARNVGLSSASSDYVTTLDGDDFYFNRDKLKNELTLINGKNDMIAYSRIQIVDINSNIIKTKFIRKSHYVKGKVTTKMLSPLYSNVLIRDYCFPREAFLNGIIYNEKSSLFEDYEFLLALSLKYRFCFTNEMGTAYRRKDFGLSQRRDSEIKKAKGLVRDKFIKKIDLFQRFLTHIYGLIFFMRKLLKKGFKKNNKSKVSLFAKTNNKTCLEGNNYIGRYTRILSTDVGVHSYIGDKSNLSYCSIGRFSSIGSNVCVINGFHPTDTFVSTHPAFYCVSNKNIKSFVKRSKFPEYRHSKDGFYVTIKNDCWIGSNVLIMAGVTIGDGVVVAAGSVVTKDLDDYGIYAGVPAKLIRYRFSNETIEKLRIIKWWNFSEISLMKYAEDFESVDDFLKKIDNN